MATWVTDKYPGGSVQVESGDLIPFKTPPRILVLHTTEGTSFPDYPNNYAPHITADPNKMQWRQHQSLDRGAWSLKPSSLVSTNGATIQIEIVGYASNIGQLSGEPLNWLMGLLHMVLAETYIPAQSSVQFIGPEAYGVAGPVRLSVGAWNVYSGIVGHQHVPGNLHWDPGIIDIQHWVSIIKSFDQPVTPPHSDPPISVTFDPTEIDMIRLYKINNTNLAWEDLGEKRRRISKEQYDNINTSLARANPAQPFVFIGGLPANDPFWGKPIDGDPYGEGYRVVGGDKVYVVTPNNYGQPSLTWVDRPTYDLWNHFAVVDLPATDPIWKLPVNA